MRTDTAEFSQLNKASAQEPAFVVEIAFDDAGTDLIYLTSHTITGLSGEVFEGVLTDISGTTQKINPDKALSEIGSLSFSALDDDLTAKQRAKLNAGLGLRGKRARFYAGFRDLEWDTYTLVQTQIIRGASYKDMEYTWSCSDIQRQMREQIFEVKQTSLAATLEPGDTEVEVFNTSGFQTVQQPPSPSGRTDAPGQKVGYIILEEDGQKEIIRYTGKTSTSFTGCTRGVLGTRPIKVEKSDNEGADNAPKVEEYVYLEMPAPMLAYAILTGSIYGETGETLPDHWHLGIAPQYIRTSDYTNIGEDLWDLSGPDLGLPARFAGVTDEDGKQFVEEQLFLLMGCYAPIYANGEIGLRRMTGVLSNAASIRTLDRRNVMKYGALKHDMNAIINRIVISWNWVDQREEYTRTNLLIDQKSIDTHGEADLKQLEFRALHGSRHSYNTLRNRFDALRDRYAGPPLRISLDLTPEQNDLEVGDIVRLQLEEVEDYTGEVTGIDRAFEVHQVKVNWKTGVVAVDLFGSSQRAEPLSPEQEGATLPDAVYAVPGATEINGANFPGAVSSSNGITTIADDIDLSGADDLRDAGAIYYCLEDLTIDGGVTVTISKNTQIRVKGFFQINGKIDGRGRGYPGSPRNEEERNIPVIPEQRFFGSSESQMGADFEQGSEFNTDTIEKAGYVNRWESMASGKHAASPELSIDIQGDLLTGLPVDITGQPGAHGQASAYIPDAWPNVPVQFAFGGAGGSGGAGVVIISSGAEFGAGGLIDTSGGAGEDAGSVFCDAYANFDRTLFGGHGAGGMPGAVYWLVVGSTSNPPTLTSTTAVAETGATYAEDYSNVVNFGDGTQFFPYVDRPYGVYVARSSTGRVPNLPNPLSFEDPESSARYLLVRNLQSAAYKVQFIAGEIEPAPDVPEFSARPSAVLATEALNTPRSANANLSTLEVSVSAPDDSAYSHALIEYRPVGAAAWTNAGPASPEALITVASDGAAYEIRARSVSTSGVVSEDYATATVTTTKIIGAEPSDPEVDEEIIIPPVRGLELEEQGNETEFTGRDAKFVWRATTVSEWFEIGSEGQLGASAGELDLYFRDYQVEIWAQNRIVRTEWVKDSAFVYSYEKNAEDYARENGTAGAWRSFEIRVYCRGRLNQVSERPAKLSVSNPAPNNITGLSITAGFNAIEIVYKKPDDLDFAGVEVWISETSGFDPDSTEPVATIADNSYAAGGLEQGKDYYVRLRPFDDFGIEGTEPTAEITVTTKSGQDLSGLSGWAYEIDPVDEQFISDNLAGDAVASEKIKNLTAAKLTAGVINATETITTEGIVRAVDDINSPQVQTGIGPTQLTLDGTPFTALMWSFSAAGVTFAIDELGNPYFKGTIEASGFSNDKLDIDEQGNLVSTGTFSFGDVAGGEYVEFDGTNLSISTPFLQFGPASAVLGNEATGEYIKYENGVFEVGPNATIGSNADRTVTVGSGGDYGTINDALIFLSRTVPAYKPGGFTAEVILLSGFTIKEQVIVSAIDLSWVRISSEDSVVPVDGSEITQNVADLGTVIPVFSAVSGGRTPKIAFAFTFSTSSNGSSKAGVYSLGEGSIVDSEVLSIEYAGAPAVFASSGGTVICSGEITTNNGGDDGVLANNNGVIRGSGGLSSSENSGDGLNIGVNSRAEFSDDIDCFDNGGDGVRVLGSSRLSTSGQISSNSNGGKGLRVSAQSDVQAGTFSTQNNGSGNFVGFASEVRCSVQWNSTNNSGDFVVDYGSVVKAGGDISCYPDDMLLFRGSIVSRGSSSSGGENVTPNTISSNGILFHF